MDEELNIWPPHEVFYIESMLVVIRMAMAGLGQLQYYLDELDAGKKIDDNRVLDLVQQLIGHAGALSRYFWPSSKEAVHVRRSEKLKAAFGITEENPLKDRKVRNFMGSLFGKTYWKRSYFKSLRPRGTVIHLCIAYVVTEK
jgi:hypothetical protein